MRAETAFDALLDFEGQRLRTCFRVRRHEAGERGQRAGHQLSGQHTVRIDRSRQADLAGWDTEEPEAAIVGQVTDENDEANAFRFRCLKRLRD